MAVNGFLQFAGESTNIITDEEYAESSVRVNGVTSGKAVSTLHNKMYLQWSTIAYVIGQLIADAGYAASDSDVDVLLSNLKNAIGTTVGGKIFNAYYGTTTYAEVDAAISAGKVVFVHDTPAAGEETLYVYEYSDDSNVYFSSAYTKNNTSGSFGWLRINSSNAWTKGSADAMIKGVDYVTAGKMAGTTLGTNSTAEGENNTVSAAYGHVEGYGNTLAPNGTYGHIEGQGNTVSGIDAHAGGANSTASGNMSFAHGYYSVASAQQAVAFGQQSEASGTAAFTAGRQTTAHGAQSAAFGNGTTANGSAQMAFGKYNIPDTTSLEIVGNGSSSTPSNARTLDAQGNETLAGKLTVGVRGSNPMDVATVGDAYAAYVTESEFGDIVTFSDGADNIPVKSFTGSIIPAQSGSGDPAPDNIRPISGWTGAEITRAGVNIWDGSYQANKNINLSTGEIVIGTFCVTGFIKVLPSTSYYYYGSCRPHYYDADKNYLSTPAGGFIANRVLTTPANCAYIVVMAVNAASIEGVSINYPSTDASYHAYDGQTITLTFGSTVYAGTITALGGGKYAIQPTHAIVDLGSLNYDYRSAKNAFDATVSGMVDGVAGTVADILCSTYPATASLTYSSWQTAPDQSIFVSSSESSRIVIRDTAYSSAAAFKTGVTGQTLLYPLATLPDPIIVSASDLATLLGNNSVWLNCGSVTELEYRADTKLYINKIIGSGSQTVVIDGGSF